jgi:hypothetical protein
MNGVKVPDALKSSKNPSRTRGWGLSNVGTGSSDQ